jgi:hypothetical protein
VVWLQRQITHNRYLTLSEYENMKRPVSATRGIRRKVTSATSNIKRSEQSSNYAASANLRRLNTPYHIQAGSAHPHAKT